MYSVRKSVFVMRFLGKRLKYLFPLSINMNGTPWNIKTCSSEKKRANVFHEKSCWMSQIRSWNIFFPFGSTVMHKNQTCCFRDHPEITFYWTIDWLVVCHRNIHHYHCHLLTLFSFALMTLTAREVLSTWETFSLHSEIYLLWLWGEK